MNKEIYCAYCKKKITKRPFRIVPISLYPVKSCVVHKKCVEKLRIELKEISNVNGNFEMGCIYKK